MFLKRPLMIQIKPPADIAEKIWLLTPTDRRRPADLLHVTALGLWDAAEIPARATDHVREVLDTVRVPRFEMKFDRIKGIGRGVELVSTIPMPEAAAFREVLADRFISGFGIPIARPGKLRPHVTLDYRKNGRSWDVRIDPISWVAEEFFLIESVVGEKRHIERGRWTLH